MTHDLDFEHAYTGWWRSGILFSIGRAFGAGNMKSNWVYYGLILLAAEKVVQHVVVTLAFYFNWEDIASTVVISPMLLMVSGAIVAILFVISLWGLVRKQAWVINLLIALAVFDLVGEFAAQGRLDIKITVSFLVASFLLILALIYRSQISQEKG